MNRFTVNVSYTYEVPDEDLAKHYDTTDLKEAAAVDESNYRNYPYLFAEEVCNGVENFSATVTAEKVDEL